MESKKFFLEKNSKGNRFEPSKKKPALPKPIFEFVIANQLDLPAPHAAKPNHADTDQKAHDG